MAVSSVKWILLLYLSTICISNAYGRGSGGRSSSRGSSRSSSRGSSRSSSRSSSSSNSGGSSSSSSGDSSSSSGVKSGVSSGSSNHGYGGNGGYNRGSGSYYRRHRNSYGYGSNKDEYSNYPTYTVPPAPQIPSYERIPYRSYDTYEYPRLTFPDHSDIEKWPKYTPLSSRKSAPDSMATYRAKGPISKIDGRIVTSRELLENQRQFSLEKLARGEIIPIGHNTKYKRSTNL